VLLGKSVEELMGDFWVIVNGVTAAYPQTYIMLPDEVQRLATQGGKGGGTHWLRVSDYDSHEFHESWNRIGRGD
jgi:hypothetical protein